MAKFAPDYMIDGSLARVAEANREYVCSAQPADFLGIAAVALADVVLTPGDGNGDFTIGNGDTSGRKVTVAQQTDVPIDVTGDATHVVLADTVNSRLLYVTTCTTQSLTAGGTVTVPAWDIEIADPS